MKRRVANSGSTRVVIYLRVSTEEQGKSGLGIEAQLQLCNDLCIRCGYEVVGIYTELGVSGSIKPLERPQFQACVAQAKNNEARIMVAKLDRLSRNLAQAASFIDGEYDCPDILFAENPTASLLELRLKALIAQEERDLISERTKAALAARVARGYEPNGRAGREAVAAKKREATEGAVTRARELQEKGIGLTQIAEMLNQEGFTTSSNSTWTKQALYKRLKQLPQID